MKKLLSQLLSSTALAKVRQKRKRELTFADACRFWGISEDTPWSVINERINLIRTTLNAAEREASSGSVVGDNDSSGGPSEIDELIELHDYLLERYDRFLDLLRRRG